MKPTLFDREEADGGAPGGERPRRRQDSLRGKTLSNLRRKLPLAWGLWVACRCQVRRCLGGLLVCRALAALPFRGSSICVGRQGDSPDRPFFSFVP